MNIKASQWIDGGVVGGWVVWRVHGVGGGGMGGMEGSWDGWVW